MGLTALNPRHNVNPRNPRNKRPALPVAPAYRIDIIPAALQSLDTTGMGIDGIFRGVGSSRGITDVVTFDITVREARQKQRVGKV